MKTKILIFIAALTYLSCDTQEQVSTKEKIVDPIQLDLSSARLGDLAILFNYTNVSDINRELPGAMNAIISDAYAELAANSAMTHVNLRIRFSAGKAILTDIHFLRSHNQTILDGMVYNSSTSSYVTNTNPSPPIDRNAVLYGNCSSGWTSVGNCSNTGGSSAVASCVSSYAQTYLAAHISGVGDCASIEVRVGILSTKVCGKTC